MSESAYAAAESASAVQGPNTAEIATKTQEILKTSGTKERIEAIPMSDEDVKEIDDTVEQQLAALRQMDIYSEETETSKTINDLFDSSRQRRSEAEEISSAFMQRNYKGLEDSDQFKAINDMENILTEYDPSRFDLAAPEKIFGLIPKPKFMQNKINSYFRKFRSAEQHLNEIMGGVMSVHDDGVRNLAELQALEKRMLKLAKSLKKTLLIQQKLAEKVEGYVAEIEDRDPTKAEKIRDEISFKLNSEILETYTVLNTVMLGQLEMGPMKRTQQMIITSCERVTTTGKLILVINQTISLSANEQGRAIDVLEGVTERINSSTESNARLVKEHIQRAKEFASNPLAAVESMQKAYTDAFAALDELKRADKELATKVKGSIAKMEQVHKRAEEKITAQASAMGAFKEIVEQKIEDKPGAAPGKPKM